MKRNFRKSIKKDIQEIDKIISSQEDGKELYETLVAKYCSYDKDFSIGLPPRTVEIPGRPIPSHKKNLLAVKNKLELFLLNNEESRFYKKEGFWPGVIAGVLSSLIASGIWALIDYVIKQW